MNEYVVVPIGENVRLVYRNDEWGVHLKVEIFKENM